METKQEEMLSINEVLKTLHILDIRTLNGYIEEGLLPKPKPVDGQSMMAKKELLGSIGVEDNYDEPFIDVEEAAEILQLEPVYVTRLASQGKIPSYRIRPSKGSKFLFRKTEIEPFQRVKFMEDDRFYTFAYTNIAENKFIYTVYKEIKNNNIISIPEQYMEVLDLIIIEKKNFTDVAKELGCVGETVRQKYRTALMHLSRGLENVFDLANDSDQKIKDLVKKNLVLEEESKRLKSLVDDDQLQDVGSIDNDSLSVYTRSVTSLGLSNRILNVLAMAKIHTVGDIMKLTLNDFKKFRSLGMKSVWEIQEKMKSLGLEIQER